MEIDAGCSIQGYVRKPRFNLHVVIDSMVSEQKTQQCQIYVTEHQLIGEFSSILPALFQKVLVNYNYYIMSRCLGKCGT